MIFFSSFMEMQEETMVVEEETTPLLVYKF